MQPEDLFTIDTMIFMFVFTFLFKGLLEYNACIYYRGSNRNVYIIFVPPFMLILRKDLFDTHMSFLENFLFRNL